MTNGTTPNAKRLLWAGFFAIFASGVGFSVRTGILAIWAAKYGFTQTELGGITGGGLWGFGIVIILGSLIADRIGYGRLMTAAFSMHVLSAVLQLFVGQIHDAFGKDVTYWSLVLAMTLFAVGNGICETVVNPMVATLFPKEKTHYLNILHAGWPGGLVAGGVLSYFMNGGKIFGWAPLGHVDWVVQMSMFLVPVAVYGIMLAGQRLPRSEAHEAGVNYGAMFLAIATPVFFVLLLCHALVGYVELGTDSWIPKITGTIMVVKTYGLLLFVYTSLLMFALRFFAGPIVEKISPLGLLCASGVIGCLGLTLLANAPTGGPEGVTAGVILFCGMAATVYAVGKTFLWPTMLAVASERFPKGGAIAIGAMGGAGMLSAGLLGAPGIGFKQDYNATQQLVRESPDTYGRYSADKEKTFLVFSVKGLDGTKTAILDLATDPTTDEKEKDRNAQEMANYMAKPALKEWWQGPVPTGQAAEEFKDKDKPPIVHATLYGGQMALQWTAVVPATMAVLYLLLIVYFWSRGGYKAVGVHDQKEKEHGEAGTYGEEPEQTPQ
jgi:MFS family permease